MSDDNKDLRRLLRRFAGEIAWGVFNRARGDLGDHGQFCVNCAAEEITTHIGSMLDDIAEGTETCEIIRQLIEAIDDWER